MTLAHFTHHVTLAYSILEQITERQVAAWIQSEPGMLQEAVG